MNKKVILIGSGFSSLAASCYLAKKGYQVTVLEKNNSLGGRARQWKKEGFLFDIGPTWYWMPDIFERFFKDFNKKPSDYYSLEKLNPAYKVYFGMNDAIDIPNNLQDILTIFEKEEKGSSVPLQKFLNTAKTNYEIAVKKLIYQPGESIFELINFETIRRLDQIFGNIRNVVRSKIKNKKLRKILEFPVLFLGAKPQNTPALYSFMNWADFGLGTWHPKGGMYKVVEAMVSLGKTLGVDYKTDTAVTKIMVKNKLVTRVEINHNTTLPTDILLSGADYNHTESLLPKIYRQYTNTYWEKKVFAPSALLFYVGFNKKIKNIAHHTLFFDAEFDSHAKQIYDTPSWPTNPLFYVSFPSVNDSNFAPKDKEAATFLVPLAPGLKDDLAQREKYFIQIIKRMENITQQSLEKYILFKKSFCVKDFIHDYNAYKGNAYGMANTLMQTAFLRPKIKSKKISNLFFTGQLTVPGPGVPPALVSGKIAAELIAKNIAL